MPFLLLMPSYNQAQYLGAALDGILAQDDPDWQLWILDNSSDDTPAVVAARADPRIRFEHRAERMDPGACLNDLLARAEGEQFSYVHTDNVLYPGYVRRMRTALAGAELALAYCDMRTIDARGARTGVFRRGSFDLARLFGLSPLGVPFAATTALARALGGFRVGDPVDDVAFCTRAFGLAQFRYVREPLLDYRVHEGSRTEAHGGMLGVRREFLRTFARIVPELAARGVDAAGALREALAEAASDLRMAAEDTALFLGNVGVGWWDGDDHLDALWRSGVLRIAGFGAAHGAPGRLALLGASSGGPRNKLLLSIFRRPAQKRFDRTLHRVHDRFVSMLVSLAYLTFGQAPPPIRAGAADALTLWACEILAQALSYRFELEAPPPAAPRWPRAQGDVQAFIDLSGRGVAPTGVPALVL